MKTRFSLLVVGSAALRVVSLATCLGNGGAPAIVARTFTRGDDTASQGSARFQTSVSVGQNNVVSTTLSSGRFAATLGFQAMLGGLDSDEDGSPDSVDGDDDGDGIPDGADPRPYDTDGDGINNLGDDDDDGDGLDDVDERSQNTSTTSRDTDGDSSDDFQEWIAGTDGADSNSVFRVKSVDGTRGEGLELRWDGVASRRYRIYRALRLPGIPVWDMQWQTNATTTLPLTYRDMESGESFFYRIGVERQ